MTKVNLAKQDRDREEKKVNSANEGREQGKTKVNPVERLRDKADMIAETISANEDQKQVGVVFTVPSDPKAAQEAKPNSNTEQTKQIKRSRPKQQKAKIMSAHLVPSSTQVGQPDPKPVHENSSSPPPTLDLKPMPKHLKYA
ncbi:hypothetical protein CR513_50488, partial [Mucuna pruriens]